MTSFLTQAKVADDGTLRTRIAICLTTLGGTDAHYWAHTHAYDYGVLPGWAAAYEQSTSEDPGGDGEAITDEMITEGVTLLLQRDNERAAAEKAEADRIRAEAEEVEQRAHAEEAAQRAFAASPGEWGGLNHGV